MTVEMKIVYEFIGPFSDEVLNVKSTENTFTAYDKIVWDPSNLKSECSNNVLQSKLYNLII